MENRRKWCLFILPKHITADANSQSYYDAIGYGADACNIKEKVTPIPKWLWTVWNIEKLFGEVGSINHPSSPVEISFERQTYKGKELRRHPS